MNIKQQIKRRLYKHKKLYIFAKTFYKKSRHLFIYFISFVGRIVGEINLRRVACKYKNKRKIKVGFIIINESIWKYDELYRLFHNSKEFEPIIYVCPYIKKGKKQYEFEMIELFQKFKKKGCNVKLTKNEDGTYIDLKNEKLDFIFFSTSWNLTFKKYLIGNFFGRLTSYVHYGYQSSALFNECYNKDIMNLGWRYFLASPTHAEYSRQYSLTKNKNTFVTGYPGLDPIIQTNKITINNYKSAKKLIVWAPHHTIDGVDNNLLSYSTFLEYCDYFLELSEKYKDKIILAFKPHPVLITKLYKVWGEEKTNEYYQKWNNIENRIKVEGDYVELFHRSSALIHDSGSFVAEYLATKKPAMFLINNEDVKKEFNSIGQEAIECHYQARNKEQIDNFIQNVVIDGGDSMENERLEFFDKYLLPPNGKSASQNIYDHIVKQIQR